MQYSQALEFINGIALFGSKLGLKHIGMLLERMGNPQDKLRFIHVAGTNGKGSTCTMLSYVLAEAGYRTGLFISPFVIDFRERIQINNEMISEEELAASVALVKKHWDEMNAIGEAPTEFEVVTAVAMDYFLRSHCDVVVLEVGLGGRFDATNIIKTPLCSVITSIDFDHMKILGNTLAGIAVEKCGIIKPGGITVCYPDQAPDVMEVISKTCAERDNELIVASKPEILEIGLKGSKILYHGLKAVIPLVGEHQTKNAATVIEAIKAARKSGLAVSDSAIINGIGKVRFPSRIEILCDSPLVLLDGAHNLSGAKSLSEALKFLGERRIHAVVGMMADKDAEGIMREILPRCHSATAVTACNARSMAAHDIALIASKYCVNVYIAESFDDAVVGPLSRCGEDGAVLIFGSLYLAGDVRPIAKNVLSRFG